MFFLELAVAPDEALIGVDLPVVFLNLDQTDNTVTDSTGYLLIHPELTNGLISIIGPQDVLTGDINLNGIPYEAGDIVLFVNHLTNPSAFPFDAIQLEASDVNADGIPATVADLIYLINIFNGNIQMPRIEPNDNNATLLVSTDAGGTIFRASSQISLGALLIKIAHPPGLNLAPTSDGQFTIAYHDDGSVLTVLAYNAGDQVMPAGTSPLFTLDGVTDGLVINELTASDAIGYLIDAVYRIEGAIPSTYELAQNYPNPFNATTKIAFGVPEASDVKLEVYSITGQRISTLVDGHFEAGNYSLNWDGTDSKGQAVSSGVYFYRLQAGSETKSLKMTMLK
jgi:hypothetical protein